MKPTPEQIVQMVPFSAHLGFEVRRCDAEACIVEVVLKPEYCTSGATAHGGFLMALADFTGAGGAWMALPDGANVDDDDREQDQHDRRCPRRQHADRDRHAIPHRTALIGLSVWDRGER